MLSVTWPVNFSVSCLVIVCGIWTNNVNIQFSVDLTCLTTVKLTYHFISFTSWLDQVCLILFLFFILNSFIFVQNYSSIISLHPEIIEGRPGTMVIESFVVDVPEGNTKDETCYFVEALIKCNLKSLADFSERLAVQDRTEPIDRIWTCFSRGYGCHGWSIQGFLILEALETDWQ